MATLGNAGIINPGIRVMNWASSSVVPQKRHVSVRPAAIYMANHLMKGLESVAIKESLADKIGAQPSLFSAEDEQGMWGVAYRGDALLVIRIPGTPLTDARLRKLTAGCYPLGNRKILWPPPRKEWFSGISVLIPACFPRPSAPEW